MASSRAQAGFPYSAYIGLCVLPAPGIVAEVVERGDPGVHRFGRAQTCAVIHIIRRHDRAQCGRGRKISVIRFFTRKVPQKRIP